jgi:hypothetical protein
MLICSFNKSLGSLDSHEFLAVLSYQLNPLVSLSLMLFDMFVLTYANCDTNSFPMYLSVAKFDLACLFLGAVFILFETTYKNILYSHYEVELFKNLNALLT